MLTRRVTICVGSVLATLVLTACGGGDGPVAPTIVPTPAPQPVTTVLIQPTTTGLRPGFGAFVDFNVPSTGTLEAEFNWTFASNDVDIFMTTPSCPSVATLTAGGCSILASDDSLQKPARFTFTVTQPGGARFWVVNFGSSNESGSGTIKLTTAR